MPEMQEPDYRKATTLIEALEAERAGADVLDAEMAGRIGSEVAEFASYFRHPVLLTRLLRAIEVQESVVFEAAMSACSSDEDRALIWSELFLDEGARAAITGEDDAGA